MREPQKEAHFREAMELLPRKVPFLPPLAVFFSLFFLLSGAADVPLGSTLSTSSTSSWTSDNRTFSLGFIPDPDNPSLFLAAITYSGGVPVWTAGGGRTVGNASVDSAGSLQLSTDGNLRLVNGSGAVVWESATAGKGVTAAALNESGDFVLTNSSDAVIWDTFSNPTDTIVELQSFTYSQVLRSGVYSFQLTNRGNLTLQWNNSITYFDTGINSSFTANKSITSPVLTLQTNGLISLSDSALSSSVNIAYSSDYGESGDMLRFVRLDSDGNLRAYSSPKGSGTANSQWSAVSDQCKVFGYCGNMGICGYNKSSPVCGCPSENFELTDPTDPRKGCTRKIKIQDCSGNSTMLQLDHTLFLTYSPDITTEQFFVGITACRLNCLSGGACLASSALGDGSGMCYLKVNNYVSGYQSSALPSTSFVKVCAPGIPNQLVTAPGPGQSGSSNVKAWVVVVIVIVTILGLVAFESGLWWCCFKDNPKYGPSSAQFALLEYASGAPVQFSYRELNRATKGFKEKIGEGGFGTVYRAVLANRTVAAVKRLEGIEQGEKQFRMEVAMISSTHHLNLVRLIGFCSEGRHRLLVYEFMKNGSLDNLLFSGDSTKKFSWSMRFHVAVGTAKAITYLHEECRDCIIHCDIKPENILLDENYNAKVSDFGLAKLINAKDHRQRTLTSVRGTRGYLAPEWLANHQITSKSDVYSYGMVLLEIVSGRRNFDVSEDTNKKKFSAWAYEEFDNGNFRNIVDRRLPEQEIDMEQVRRAVQVSFWCIQEQPSQRPHMGKVVQMLEGIMEIDRPPAPRNIEGGTAFSTDDNTSISMLSTYAAPVVSSSSSQVYANSSSNSRINVEKPSSSLLSSELL